MIMKYATYYLIIGILLLCQFQVLAQSKNPEFKAKRAVEIYVRDKKPDNSYYAPYNYFEFKKHMPTEYKELEELIEVSEVLPTMKQHYGKKKLDSLIALNDSRIQNKKKEIMDKKLRFSYEIVHSYGFKDELGNIKVLRYRFYLNHAFKIKDVRLIFSIPITKDQAEEAALFQKRKLLYKLNDIEQDRKSSDEIHTFFETGLKDTHYDPEVFYAACRMIKIIRSDGNVNLDIYGLRSIKAFISQTRPDMKGYKSINYSHFLEIENANDNFKYVMYHKYEYKEDKKKVSDIVGIYFDKYFVIRKVERIEGEDDKLFEKD